MNPDIHVPKVSSGTAVSSGETGGGTVASVVQVTAKVGNFWKRSGTGFCINQWDTYVITARHLVMAADGCGPTDLDIRIGTGPAAERLHWTGVAFFPPARDVDVAVIRVRESLVSPLEGAQVEVARESDKIKAQIWGYPEARTVLGKWNTEASLKWPWLQLTRSGVPGMSGGPVVVVPGDGTSPDQVIGIYLGLKQQPDGTLTATAHAITDEDVERCWRQLQGIA